MIGSVLWFKSFLDLGFLVALAIEDLFFAFWRSLPIVILLAVPRM